jgi:hypothetical protein
MRITSSVWAAETMQHAVMRRQRHCYEQNQQNNAHLCLLIALNDAIVVIRSLHVESTVIFGWQHYEGYSFDRHQATVQHRRKRRRSTAF